MHDAFRATTIDPFSTMSPPGDETHQQGKQGKKDKQTQQKQRRQQSNANNNAAKSGDATAVGAKADTQQQQQQQHGQQQSQKRKPLPAIHRDKPQDEFISRAHYETTLQSFHRRNVAPIAKVLGEVWQLVASKETLYIVSGAGLVLLTIGASEALLCLRTDVPVLSADALHFVGSYSTRQLLPSFIWSTTPADLICHSIGLEASQILRTFDFVPHESSMFGAGGGGGSGANGATA